MADSDSIERDSEPTPFLTRALLWRFLAVGLFVALGTFAVFQSFSGPKTDPHAGEDHDLIAGVDSQSAGTDLENANDGRVAGSSVGFSIKKPAVETAKKSDSGFSPRLNASPSGFSSKSTAAVAKPSVSKPLASQPPTRPPSGFGNAGKVIKPNVVVSSSKSGFSPSGFSPNNNSTPSKPSFSPVAKTVSKTTFSPSTTRPVNPIGGFSAGGQKPAAPAAKPSDRFAQLTTRGFEPQNASQGISAATESSRRAAAALGNNASTAAKSAATATSDSFNSLRNSVNRSASNASDEASTLLSAAKTKIGNTVGSTVDAGTGAAANLLNKASNSLSSPFAKPSTHQVSRSAASPKPPTNLVAAQPSASLNPSAVLRPVQSTASGSGSSSGLRSFADRRSSAPQTTSNPSPNSTGSSSRSPFAGRGTGAGGGSKESSNSAAAASKESSPFGNASSSSSPSSGFGGGNTLARTSRGDAPAGRSLTNQSNDRPTTASSSSSTSTLASNSSQLNAILASSVGSRSLNTPGDRRLEGVQAPSLTIEKVSPREIQVNQAADFEIRVRNVGRVAADNVMVVDRVPTGTEFIGASPEPSKLERSGDVQWTIGTIEPGQEKRIRFQLRPTQPGEIGSVAHVLFATQASMRTVVTKPVLDIVHSARPRVLIGDNVVFDVIVENKGDGPATEVIVQEEVPDQLEYQEGFRQLEYEVGTLMPGQKRTIQLALRADKVGEFRNVVFVTGKGGLEAKHEIDVEVIAPEIRVTSEGPNRRFLRRQATHRFTIENRGTAEANNVNLMARLPGGLRYISSDNRGRYDSNSHAVYWKMPSLKDGVAGTVELTTIPVEVGQQDIKFEANADLRMTAQTTQELSVEHLVDVYFEIDDVVDPIEVGTDTSYRLRILNQGTKVASNVQLQVEFPRGLEPTAVDGDLRNQIQGQQVAFEPISSLPPGQEVQITIRARGNAPGDHRVIASIRSDGREVEISKEDTTRVYADR